MVCKPRTVNYFFCHNELGISSSKRKQCFTSEFNSPAAAEVAAEAAEAPAALAAAAALAAPLAVHQYRVH